MLVDKDPISNVENINKKYNSLLKLHNEKCQCKCGKRTTAEKGTNTALNIVTGADVEIDKNTLHKIVTSKMARFSIDLFKDKDSDIAYYTGFPNYGILKIAFNILFEYGDTTNYKNSRFGENSQNRKKLSKEDEFF